MSPEIQQRMKKKLEGFRARYPLRDGRRFQFLSMHDEPETVTIAPRTSETGPVEKLIKKDLNLKRPEALEMQSLVNQLRILGAKVVGWP